MIDIDERRIYVIVPHTVQASDPSDGTPLASVTMSPGRLMAQAAHVVSQMRGDESQRTRPRIAGYDIFKTTTTIVLSARNSKELDLLRRMLIEHSSGGIEAMNSENPPEEKFGVCWFYDINAPFYGTDAGVQTAVCTTPVFAYQVEAVLGHLELY